MANSFIHRKENPSVFLIAEMSRCKCNGKFDITKHPQYKYLSDANPKNNFDIEKFLSTQLKTKPDDVYEVFEVDASDVSATA